MTINLLEDVAPASNSLGAITEVGQRMFDLTVEIEQLEERLREKKWELRKISEEELPDLMQELNVKDFTLGNGAKLEVREFTSHSIPTKTSINHRKEEDAKNELILRRKACFNWLKENNAGNLIKNGIKVTFQKGQDKECDAFTKDILSKGYEFEREIGVSYPQLNGHFKDLMADGKKLPTDLFKIYTGRVAKIKNLKEFVR